MGMKVLIGETSKYSLQQQHTFSVQGGVKKLTIMPVLGICMIQVF